MDDNVFSFLQSSSATHGAKILRVPARELLSDDKRLEASFYGSEGYQALRSLEKSGFRIETIGSLASIAQPPIFKRCFVPDAAHGVPYLNGIQLMELMPRPNTWLSRECTDVLGELILREGMVVILDAGQNAGETVVFATGDLDGFATTNNTIRVIGCDANCSSEFLYAYLCSRVGNFLLTRVRYGSSIPHIEPRHVSAICVPTFPRAFHSEITSLIVTVMKKRVEANSLLRAADESVWKQCYMERPINAELTDESYETSIVASTDLLTEYEGQSRIRLEATFQAPHVRKIVAQIKSKSTWARLSDCVNQIPYTGPGSMPGVPKVEPEIGTPTITGRDLALTRMRPAYYLSTANPRILEKLRPTSGTTLVMCAGTPGKTDYVCHNYEDWFVSLDVIRVVPAPEKLHPGFVYAFLTSQLGQAQMLRHTYGSVIPRIHSRQVSEVVVPIPADKGEATGEMVDQAFALRAEALRIERRAIELLTEAIERGRKYTEAEWGSEY